MPEAADIFAKGPKIGTPGPAGASDFPLVAPRRARTLDP